VVATHPTNITFSVSNNLLTLSWPPGHQGWRLQTQTNSRAAGLGTNWYDVPGSTTTNSLSLPLDLMNETVFHRLTYP
jgi:hypothetical protein